MLRRQPKDVALLDAVDLQLLEGVDRGLTWRALVASAGCDPDEAALRIMRLIQQGHLQGKPGEDSAPPTVHTAATVPPPARATFSRSAVTRPVQAPGAVPEPRPDTSTAPPPPAVRTPPPSGRPLTANAAAAREALLRELATRRSGASIPPVSPSSWPSGSLRPPPGEAHSGFYSVRPDPARSGSAPRESEPAPGAGTGHASRPTPGRYSVQAEDRPSPEPASRFDTPLAELIEEFARGSELQRWCAARLHEAQHHEAMGQDQLAIAALQLAMAQHSDPRIRTERDRLQARTLKAASGVYRARALTEERQSKHKEAAESWGKVLEACPEDTEAAVHAASCCMEIGEIKQAGHYARRAVELAPENVAAHRLLLRFFRKSGMELNANREREILRKLAKY